VRYLTLICIIFIFSVNAKGVNCEQVAKNHQKVFENHETRMFMDRLEVLLELRKVIISEGAFKSQQQLDKELFLSVRSVFYSHAIQPEHVERIKSLSELFKTYPLLVTSKEIEEFNKIIIQISI
jgi:hypothetical protein